MPKRINAIATTATSAAGDDYLMIDGATNNSRKILASSLFASPFPIGATTPSTGAFTAASVSASAPLFTAITTGQTSRARFGSVAALERAYLTQNLSYDGTNWQRDDTAQAAGMLVVGGTGFTYYNAPAGANPATITARFSVTDTGINSTAIGATTPSTGAFTSLSATGTASANSGQFGSTSGVDYAVLAYKNNTVAALLARQDNASGKIAQFQYAGSDIAIINSTGLSVTGTGAFTSTLSSANHTISASSGAQTIWQNTGDLNRGFVVRCIVGTGVQLHTTSSIYPLLLGVDGVTYATLTTTSFAVTGAISATATGAALTLSGATTSNRRIDIGNTGQTTNIGVEQSTGGAIISGSTAYATVINSGANVPVQIGVNSVLIGSFSSTGLSVTGALSATGAVTSNSGNNTAAFLATGATTGWSGYRITNTGGTTYFGMEASAGGTLVTGSTAYDALIRTTGGLSISVDNGSSTVARFSSSGSSFNGNLTQTNGTYVWRTTGDLDTTATAYITFQDNSTGSYSERGWFGFGNGDGHIDLTNNVTGKGVYIRAEGTRIGYFSSTGLSVTGTGTFTGNIYTGTSSDAGARLHVAYPGAGDASVSIGASIRTPNTGTSTAIQFVNTSGSPTEVGRITQTTTSTAYITSSDARLKTDLGGFSLQDLAAPLFSLRLRKYRWKAWGDTDRAAYGVFAQEALETNPWMVSYDKASDHYGVNWMAAMPNVIAAVQVHEDEIAQLRREVAELKAKLAGLEFR